jgi:2OG-Fe(II) oxygenase superfamily
MDWVEQVKAVVAAEARDAELRGGVESSLEPAGTVIEYKLVDGNAVSSGLPWLDSLYRGQFRTWASELFGEELLASDQTTNGVNVNVLTHEGSRYELHVDTNPLTGLLFVTTHEESDGGGLVFHGQYDSCRCSPVSGHLLLFDARQAPHEVERLRTADIRISVPMNYFTADALAARSPGLDEYLYGA